jgi:hypothetical protein
MLEPLTNSIDGDVLPLFVSDELAHYKTVLEELYSHEEPVPKTGKRGRPAKPVQVIDKNLAYATVKKTRKGGKVVKVGRSVSIGTMEQVKARLEDSPSKTINTSYVERSNLDWRLWDAHLTRKSLCFAKSLRWLQAKFALCVTWYNFGRSHRSLPKIYGPKTTPAMAAKIAREPWSMADLVRWPINVN